MVIKSTPGTLERGLRVQFFEAFMTRMPAVAEKIGRACTVVPSDGSFEKYEWLGEVPSVKEFVDERDFGDLSDTSYSVTNKTWEGSLKVDRDQVSDGRLTGIGIRIQQLATRAAVHPLKLLYETLVTNGNCYDGTALFGNSHTARGEQSAAQDNLLAGTGTTTAALKTDLQSAIAGMSKFVDEANDPFHWILDPADLVVVVPPDLEFAMKEAVNATIISNTSNILAGVIGDVWVVPGNIFTDADDWYLLHTGDPMKALIFQEREAVSFDAVETGDDAFTRKVWKYGTYARYQCAPGMWQYGVKTTN